MKCDIAILGGGISGLSTAWYLKKKLGPSAKICILEKNARLGGWVHTLYEQGFYCEEGPRSCRIRGAGKATLALLEELQLAAAVVAPSPHANTRFILTAKGLKPLPQTLWQALFSPLTRNLCLSLLKEPFIHHAKNKEDLSIAQVLGPRLGQMALKQLVSPFVSGIFAGDIHALSFKSCFPEYAQKLQQSSLFKALLTAKKEAPIQAPYTHLKGQTLFSLKKGMGQLIAALQAALKENVFLNHPIQKLSFKNNLYTLSVPNDEIQARSVISTLPAFNLAELFAPIDRELSDQLFSIPAASLAVVHLAYDRELPLKPGFGYLAEASSKPALSPSPVLGIVFDSHVFPRSTFPHTQLTAMLGGVHYPNVLNLSDQELLALALEAVEQNLNVNQAPTFAHITRAPHAIAQYNVGHQQKLEHIERQIKEKWPQFFFLGASFYGAAVNDCILKAQLFSQTFNFSRV